MKADTTGLSRRSALVGLGAGMCCGALQTSPAIALPAVPNASSMAKIDIYNHVMPQSYLELVQQRYGNAGMVKRLTAIRNLWDMDARIEMLAQWPEVQQVVSLATPAPEEIAGPTESPMIARVANDGMARICADHPARFPTFVATLPMNNIPEAVKEMDRAIGTLGARGIEIKTNIAGRPLDDPGFVPIFERATNHHGVAIWMHPTRSAAMSDYAAEPKSRYEIWQVMGWPYETTAAMARIVFSGILDRLPSMRIITHHCGGMIPYFAGRAETLWTQMGSRTADEDYSKVLSSLKRPFMEYFKMFYGDTVLGGSSSALRCGLDFFGEDRIVFASDCPFDPQGGPMFIEDGIASIEALHLTDSARQKIYIENALSLLKSNVPVLTPA